MLEILMHWLHIQEEAYERIKRTRYIKSKQTSVSKMLFPILSFNLLYYLISRFSCSGVRKLLRFDHLGILWWHTEWFKVSLLIIVVKWICILQTFYFFPINSICFYFFNDGIFHKYNQYFLSIKIYFFKNICLTYVVKNLIVIFFFHKATRHHFFWLRLLRQISLS